MTLQEIWYIILCKWNGARRAVSFKLGREGHTQLSCMPQMTMWFHMSPHGCCRYVPWVHTSRFVLCVILAQWSCSCNGTEKYWHQSFALLLGLVGFNCPIHIRPSDFLSPPLHYTHLMHKKMRIGLWVYPATPFQISSITQWKPSQAADLRKPWPSQQ